MTDTSLGSLLKYRKGRPPLKDVGVVDVVPVLTPDYMRNGVPSEFTPRLPGQLLMNGTELVLLWDGSNAGEFFRARPGSLGSTMVAFAFNQDDLDSDYLYYELKRFEPSLKAKTSGSGIPHVDKEVLLAHEIRKPERSQQAKIAKVLATVDRAIAQTDALLAKQQRVKVGLMQELLARGIDADGNLRQKQNDDAVLYPGWKIKRLSEVAEVSSGVTLGQQISTLNTITLPYLRVFNVQDGYLNLSDVKTVTIRDYELDRYRLQKGDVLMNEGGDFDKLGRGAVWDGQIEPCLHQNHVFRVRANRQILLPDFVALISSSVYGKAFFVLNSKQSTNLASINSTQLKSFRVPCPDLKEQERILEVIGKQDRLRRESQRSYHKLKLLKAGLMQDLLSGRVSVLPLLDESE